VVAAEHPQPCYVVRNSRPLDRADPMSLTFFKKKLCLIPSLHLLGDDGEAASTLASNGPLKASRKMNMSYFYEIFLFFGVIFRQVSV
jgi:hypothetical protein